MRSATLLPAALAGFLAVAAQVAAAQNFTPLEPFTAYLTGQRYDSSVRVQMTMDVRFALASDGSFVEERLNDGEVAIRIIGDRKTQTRTAVDFMTESTTTSWLPPQSYPLPSCSVPPMWAAPALNCYGLQKIEYIKPDGSPETINSVSTVTRLVRGEPRASLFAAPRDFTEQKPSEVYAEYHRRHPNEASGTRQPGAKVQDQAYETQPGELAAESYTFSGTT